MKTIRLTADFPQLIEERTYAKGDVVHVRDQVADEKIRLGFAKLAEGQPIANPEVNHLADAIDPAPTPEQGGPETTDPNARPPGAPIVAENPGLVELDRAVKAGKPKASAKS